MQATALRHSALDWASALLVAASLLAPVAAVFGHPAGASQPGVGGGPLAETESVAIGLVGPGTPSLAMPVPDALARPVGGAAGFVSIQPSLEAKRAFVTEGVSPAAQLDMDGVSFGLADLEGRRAGVNLSFPGSNLVEPGPVGEQRFTSFHYQGGTPSEWREGRPTFGGLRYLRLYDGIDLSFSAAGGRLKYELQAAPGADLESVAFAYAAPAVLFLESPIALRVSQGAFEIRDSIAESYDAEGRTVHCSFALRSASAVGFSCRDWLGTSPLTVDPVLYGTYIGGNGQDNVVAAVVDASGNYFLAGRTTSNDFPTTAGAYDRIWSGFDDFYVMKISSTNQLLWATYIGGTSNDFVNSLVVGPDGGPTVGGYTTSSDFPNTTGAFDNTTTYLVDEGFVLHLTAAGALGFSTFLGGSAQDEVWAVATNGAGEVYATGYTQSADFPTTNGSYSENYSSPGQGDVFVTKLLSDGTAALYSTFIGGTAWEAAFGLAVDANGSAIVVGYSTSTDYPTTIGALSRTLQGPGDGIVTGLTPDGSQLSFSTFVGGPPSEILLHMLVDGAGNVLFLGTTSAAGSPNTTGAYKTTYGGGPLDAWVGAVNPNGSALLFGSYLGGTGNDGPRAFGADSSGNLYIGLYTDSPALPTTAMALNSAYGGNTDGYLVKLNRSGDRLLSATYFGNNGYDTIETLVVRGPDRLLIGGYTSPPGIPITLDAFDGTLSGFNDGYAAELDLRVFNLSVRTAAPGLSFRVDAILHTDRYDFVCPAGATYRLNATSAQVNGSTRFLFASWSDGGPLEHNVTCSGDQVFVASFSRQFLLRIVSDPPGLTLDADGAAYVGFGQLWCDENSTHTVFAPSPQPTADANALKRQVFSNWSDGGSASHIVTASGPVNLTAHFGIEYLVGIDTDPPGLSMTIDSASSSVPAAFWWAENTTHTLEVLAIEQLQPESRFIFESWSDGGAAAHSVIADQPKALVARFRTEFQVEVDTDPPGLQVLVDGANTTAPAQLWWAEGSSHAVGMNSTQTVEATRYLFAQWSDGGAILHNVTAALNLSVRASMSTQFYVELLSDPPGLFVLFDGPNRPTPYGTWIQNGSSHTVGVAAVLGATPFERWVFLNWSDGGLQNRTITVTAPLSITARFVQEHRVTVDTLYGDVTCDRADCWYPAGATATINVSSPVPGVNGTRYAFLRWEGAAGGIALALTLVMSSPLNVTAQWTTEYLLTIVSAYGNVTGGGWYASGAAASLSVVATDATVGGEHYRFVGWTGPTASQGGDTSISMTAARTVTARWELVPEAPSAPVPILIVLLAGAGGSAAAVLLWRKRAGGAPSKQPAAAEKEAPARGTGEPQSSAPNVAQAPAAEAAAPATFPCPTCGSPVAPGQATCATCGLALEW